MVPPAAAAPRLHLVHGAEQVIARSMCLKQVLHRNCEKNRVILAHDSYEIRALWR
jgi:hypothetical protein